MRTPPLIGWVLLAHLLLILPWLSYRSALRMRAARAGTTPPGEAALPPFTQIFAGTLTLLIALFLLAWFTAGRYQYELFWYRSLGPGEIGAGAAALAGYFLLRLGSRAMRTPEERRAMAVRQLMPRARNEWALYLVVCLAAGIAEESAYRGVGMHALSLALGNSWIAAAVLSVAFALAHITQEWKSVGIVLAMAVHVIYDWMAALLLVREMRAEETAARAGSPPAPAR